MTIEHAVITDPEIHEPKGAATAQAGHVYVSDGAGGGVWSPPELEGQGAASAGEVPHSDGLGGVDWTTQPIVGTLSQGVYDYNDATTASTPIPLTVAATDYKLTNDGAGPNTNLTYKLPTLDHVWITASDHFSWLDGLALSLGDTVDIRFDVEFTTGLNNTEITLDMHLGVGGTPYTLPIIENINIVTAGVTRELRQLSIYMGDTNTLNFPSEVFARASKTGTTVIVHGWFVRVIHTNA